MLIYQPEADTIEYNTVNSVREIVTEHGKTVFAMLDALRASDPFSPAHTQLMGLWTCLNDMAGTFPPRQPQFLAGEPGFFGEIAYSVEILDERHFSGLYFYPQVLERVRLLLRDEEADRAEAFGGALDGLMAQSPVLREIVEKHGWHYAGVDMDSVTINTRQFTAGSIEPASVEKARDIVLQYGDAVRDVLFLLRTDSERHPSIKKILNTETAHGIMWHMLGVWTCLNDVASGFPPRLPSQNGISADAWQSILTGQGIQRVRDERYFEGMLYFPAALSRAKEVSTERLGEALDGLNAAVEAWISRSPVLTEMVEDHARMHGITRGELPGRV